MAETSGFFNAEKLQDGSFDRVYLAESFASYFARFIGNGLFGGSVGTLQVIPNGTYSVAVQSGEGFINGYWYQNSSALAFPLAPSHAAPRIDSVVLRLDLFSRSISLALVTGTPSVNPVPTPLTRDDSTWELRLCNINVAANAASITADSIIDTRFDPHQCGLVHGVVDQLDTTEYGNRLNGFIDQYIANVSTDYQEHFLTPLADKITQAAVDYQNDFTTPLADKITQATADYTAFQSAIDAFLPNLDSLKNLATEAYDDFLVWLAQQKTGASQQIQELVSELEQLIGSGGDLGDLLARIVEVENTLLTEQQIQTLINTAIKNLPPSGLTEQAVRELLKAELAELPPSGLTEEQVQELIDAAIDKLPHVPAVIRTNTHMTIGHRIKTDITGAETGVIHVKIKTFHLTFVGSPTVTDLYCTIRSDGTIVAGSFKQLNRGFVADRAIVYLDTDNTWTFYMGYHTSAESVNPILIQAEVTKFDTDDATAAVELKIETTVNRLTDITAWTTAERDTELVNVDGTLKAGCVQVPVSAYRESLMRQHFDRSLWFATADGSDVFGNGHARITSAKSLSRVLQECPRGYSGTIQINKYCAVTPGVGTAAIAVWNVATTYNTGDQCVYAGYVFRRTGAAITGGTAPTITTPGAGWEHVNLTTVSRGAWSSGTAYEVQDTVTHGGLSYICVQAHTNVTPVNTGSNRWQVCGEYNPVVTETSDLSNIGGLVFSNAGNVKVIFLGGLVLNYNRHVIFNTPIYVHNTLAINQTSGVIMNNNGTYEAGVFQVSHVGNLLILAHLVVHSYATTNNTACAYFAQSVEVRLTDNLTRSGWGVYHNSSVMFMNPLTLIGCVGANTASGLLVSGSRVTTRGNVIISGFREQMLSTSGGTIENQSATTILSRGTNTTAAASCRAIQVNARATYIQGRGLSVVRNDGITDSVSVQGAFIDWGKILALPGAM